MILRSRLLESVRGVRHGFGSRTEPIPSDLISDWDLGKPVWKQVHGAACAEVRGTGDQVGEVDALYTREPAQPVAVVTADCVPILLARQSGGMVAAVHAGWRGTQGEIVRKLIHELRALGENPARWVAAIGPAIGPCCYEVSEDLARDFGTQFGGTVVPQYRHLDLPEANRLQLEAAGLGGVELLRACTRCSEDAQGAPLFHSYRREGGGTRQYSMILSGKVDP